MGVNFRFVGVLFLFLISLTSVYAQEGGAAYNFGTMQEETGINIEPGETYTTKIYVYNIYGNRITHVTFTVTQAPQDWDIVLEPEVHTITTNISGELVTVEENLYAEPTSPVGEIPESVPEGMEYLQAGGVEGYIPAKVLKVTIKVPESAPLGKTYTITVNAKATWLGQGGMVVLSQDRNFDFTVKTVTRKFTEEIVKETPKPEEEGAPPIPWKYLIIGSVVTILFLAVLYGIYNVVKKGRKGS
jgi:hypothetical protein